MAKFHITIEKDDGTKIEDVQAKFDDIALASMVASCEALGFTDAEGAAITGARTVSIAIRQWLFNHIKEYSKAQAANEARRRVEEVFKQINDNIVVE